MQAPRTLAAAFLSAAMLLTSGVAFADKGGKNHTNAADAASAPGHASHVPGHEPGHEPGSAAGQPNGMHGDDGPHPFGNPNSGSKHDTNAADRNLHSTDRDASSSDRDFSNSTNFKGSSDEAAQGRITLQTATGKVQFDIDASMMQKIEARGAHQALIFYSADGKHITSISAPGEKAKVRVIGSNSTSLLVATSDNQTRVIALDAKTMTRLHLHNGSTITMTTLDEHRARIVADDLVKKHQFDKFSGQRNISDSDNKHKNAKKANQHVANNDFDAKQHKVAKGKCGDAASTNGRNNPAFANQMAKDARNDASGHNPPGLPHECVNPAGHTRGFCKQGGSTGDVDCGGGSGGGGGTDVDVAKTHADTNTDTDTDTHARKIAKSKCGDAASSSGRNNPAFANQMAKDAKNDASGHNPPGLPHECLNPAGHTRGFCKHGSSSSGVDCGSGSSGGGGTDVDVAKAHTDTKADTNTDTDTHARKIAKGKCGSTTSTSGRSNPAFANQMAKDARNDASGHNPPGLPHECVNPAGHTRGFCKHGSSSESSDCASASGSVSVPVALAPVGGQVNSSVAAPAQGTQVHGTPVAVAPVNGTPVAVAPVNGTPVAVTPAHGTPVAAQQPRHGITPLKPGPVSMGGLPVAGASAPGPVGLPTPAVVGVASVPSAPSRTARAGHPTRVMGAATGPAASRPTYVSPASIALVRPLANTPCVWHKTSVAAATVGPARRVGMMAVSTHHPRHHLLCH